MSVEFTIFKIFYFKLDFTQLRLGTLNLGINFSTQISSYEFDEKTDKLIGRVKTGFDIWLGIASLHLGVLSKERI